MWVGLYVVSIILIFSAMNIQSCISFLDLPCLDIVPLLHRPYWVEYCISLGNFIPGNKFPVFLITVTIDSLHCGIYKIFLVWLLHGRVNIYFIFVFLGQLGNIIFHFLFSIIVLFHNSLIEVGRLFCIGYVPITWLLISSLNGLTCLGYWPWWLSQYLLLLFYWLGFSFVLDWRSLYWFSLRGLDVLVVLRYYNSNIFQLRLVMNHWIRARSLLYGMDMMRPVSP